MKAFSEFIIFELSLIEFQNLSVQHVFDFK